MKRTDGLAECVVFSSQKGGTGRTTSCLSIAGYLSKSGAKVLVVDFDPHANATSGLGIDGMTLKNSICDIVLASCNGHKRMPITKAILKTDIENLHLIPSEKDLIAVEFFMHRVKDRMNILNQMLSDIRHYYDYILIDTPATPGLLMVNGICASNHVVVPVDPSIFSLEALENLKDTLNEIRRRNGHSIKRVTAVIVRYVKPNFFTFISPASSQSQTVEMRMRELFSSVYIVPEAIEIYEAQRRGTPVSHFAPKSKVGRAYEEIARMISLNSGQ